MDYEKKYKEEIIRATQLWECGDITRENLEYIFPELKESEDDRVRKALIQGFNECLDLSSYPKNAQKYWHGIVIEDILAWLEKQGEQKPIINVPSREVILAIWDLGNEWKELTNGSISTEYGTQLDYIQKHWYESEYYLQKKQGEQKVSYTTIVETGDGGINALVTRYLPIDGCDGKQEPTDKVESKDYSSIDPHFGKPIDKQKPKFHEGEWIISNDKKSTYQVIEVKRGIYVIRDNADDHEYHIGIEACERSGRFWTISDAKPGDVLYSQKHNLIWIYKDNKHYYASINLNYADGISFDGDIVIPSDVCPANREQRDTLMKAMADAGYTFDFDKKELKKIEKKFNVGDEIKTANEEPLAITKIDEKGYWSEDLFICDFDDAAKWELVEQKPAWSEEDEKIVLGIEQVMTCASFLNIVPDKIEKIKDWLKSLKQKCTWKPSDEQLDALQYVYRNFNPLPSDKLGWNSLKTLELMYHDLKKLREE